MIQTICKEKNLLPLSDSVRSTIELHRRTRFNQRVLSPMIKCTVWNLLATNLATFPPPKKDKFMEDRQGLLLFMDVFCQLNCRLLALTTGCCKMTQRWGYCPRFYSHEFPKCSQPTVGERQRWLRWTYGLIQKNNPHDPF